MKVLWFSPVPSCFSPTLAGGWVGSLEEAIRNYCQEIELGIVFEYNKTGKETRNKVTYYPIHVDNIPSPKKKYAALRPFYLKAIEDFKPDIIQCFGTERWHYGLLTKEVNIPFVIHIMGFMNIYDVMDERVIHKSDYWKYFSYNPLKVWLNNKSFATREENQQLEREIMTSNHYFMGRTEWDKNIVKYYSKNAKYYHCAEAIRKEIYNSKSKWRFHNRGKVKLLTIGNAGSLKGNEIMLQAAWLLKNRFNFDFEWKYTSNPKAMSYFEKLNGINSSDVNIDLIGRLDASQIAEVLASADFYIHPAIIDNSPNTVCEAQLIGTPIIATNVGGIPQLVEDGQTGWVYPYSEPHALAFEIMNLYEQRDLLQHVSDNEYKVSHERHNPETIVKTLVSIYKDIINDWNS